MNLDLGLTGILRGLSNLVEKLGDLAEKGEELRQSGEIGGAAGGKQIKGVYGFTVKVGLGGEGLKVEPFGNIHKDKATGQAVVQEIREPMVDIFEEEGQVLVIAEMPGISLEDIQLDVKDDILTLAAQKGEKRYRKEVLLPGAFRRDKITVSCNNGVAEIKCRRE